MITHRNRPAFNPQDWSNKSAIARIDKVGGGKRQTEEQLAAVVLNTRRNQARLERALEAGNIVRAGTLSALVAKGMADARRLAETLEEGGRTTFGKAKTIGHGRVVTMESITAIRPIINWAKGEQEATVAATGTAMLPTLPKATTTVGVTGDHKATMERMAAATAHKASRDAEAAAKAEAARITKAKAGKAKIRKAGKRS